MTADARASFESHVRRAIARAERAVERSKGDAPAVDDPPVVPNPHARDLALALGLGDDELDFAWSVVAHAVEPRVVAAARFVFGGEGRLGVALAHHVAWAELPAERSRALLALLDAHHPLRAYGIVVPASDDPIVGISTPWTTTQRACAFLRGDAEIDPLIAAIGGAVDVGPTRHSPDQARVIDSIRGWLASPAPSTIVVEGSAGSGRRVALALAARPRRVIAIDCARVPVRAAIGVLVALRREALLSDAVPLAANFDALWSRLENVEDARSSLAALLDAITGPFLVTTATPGLDLGAARRGILRARWPLPDAATRRTLWTDVLGDDQRDAQLDVVANRFELGAGGIVASARSASQRASQRGAAHATFADIAAGVQDNIAEQIGELARRVEVKQTWSDLVLPPDTAEDVHALVSRIRNAHLVLDEWGFRAKLARGAGVAALFSGPPGTGKTMVAGLVARELELELYQVDLSRIVSKWVGETEKQLAKVFEAAEAGHALLLFDEADALFAKRTAEVKSAVDRYANLEVNYLLQRVESFGGVVILTTNLDASIDPALRRRLASHIVFASPEADEQVKLWRTMLTPRAPIAPGIDFRALADEFPDLTGANVRNAVLTAAFLAARGGGPITADLLTRGARAEYRAMGRVLSTDRK